MSTASAPPLAASPPNDELARETLYAVIAAIARGPDLGRVLPGVVDLLTDATACHACFIYLLDGGTLRMRAASSIYSQFVEQIEIGIDEGVCGWVARNCEPALIRDAAITDPRMKLVPELDEERFQSMIAVPLVVGREQVIGVVVLHTEAPREFGQDVVDFLVNVASLVAGAIDNAGHYEQARLRAERLSALTELGHEIAAVGARDELYRVACEGAAELLAAAGARLSLVDRSEGRLDLVAASGQWARAGAPTSLLPSEPSGPELAARLVAGPEELGVLAISRPGPDFSTEDMRLLQAVGNQLAVALQKIELIEQLTGENLLSDLFDALAAGRDAAAESRARAVRYDLSRPAVIAVIEALEESPGNFATSAERAGARLRRLVPGALVDCGNDAVRALLPLSAAGTATKLARLDDALAELALNECLAIGRSEPRTGLKRGGQSLVEAAHAARVSAALQPRGGACGYAELGVYRYLERGDGDGRPDERHAAAIAVLAQYDRHRGGALVATLEHYLAARSGLAQVARDLYIHPNTLRQRLERIEELTEMKLAQEDLLCLELALKYSHLRGRPRS
jgi:GAF domain-containing protein